MKELSVKLGVQQRVLPEYRARFFDSLATVCPQGLYVFAGKAHASEAIADIYDMKLAHYCAANNLNLLSGGFYTCVQTNFIQWLEEYQPEALIVEANPRYLLTPQAVRWMHSHHRPVIGWGLGAHKGKGLQDALRYRFLQSLDAIIAYSQAGAEQYRSLGCKIRRVFVAPNAVASRPERPAISRPEKFIDGRPYLLYVGRLQKRKKLDLLLQACSNLSEAYRPRLVIIGDGPEKESLQQLAAQVYPQTEFVGAKHGEELEPFYAAADLFVLPGTGGLAVQQAMAHTLPVVVGEADGTQAELVRAENGWLVPEITAEKLTTVLHSALTDIGQLRLRGRASYRIVAEEVNLERMVEVFFEALDSVL